MHKQGKDWLLVADGHMADTDIIKSYVATHLILVCDGACDAMINAGIRFHVVLGDMDSISQQSLEHVQGDVNISVVSTPDQNATDLEKAIDYLDTLQAKNIVIANALGGRVDHSLYNLRLLARCHRPSRSLTMINVNEVIYYMNNQVAQISGLVGSPVAVMGFERAVVTSQGLAYDMHHHQVGLPGTDSVSNSLGRDMATVTIVGQALLVVHKCSLVSDS